MVRKGNISYKSEQFHRSETGRVCKTPRIVLERLNIPLDSVVLVKGDSIIYPLDNFEGKQSEVSSIIDITDSDENNSEDEEFQEIIVKRFQSTRDNSVFKKTELTNLKFWHSDNLKKYSKVHITTKPGPRSKKTLLTKTKFLPKKILKMAHNSDGIRKNEQTNTSLNVDESLLSDKEDTEHHIKRNIKNNGCFLESNTKKDSVIEKELPNRRTSIDNSEDSFKASSVGIDVKEMKENKSQIDNKTSEALDENDLSQDDDESKIKYGHVDKKRSYERKIDLTPSRISQRIKNKKVKFSARQLLAGGDIRALRKELNEPNAKKALSPKKSFSKIKAGSTADINANLNNNSNLPLLNLRESLIAISPPQEKRLEDNSGSFINLHQNLNLTEENECEDSKKTSETNKQNQTCSSMETENIINNDQTDSAVKPTNHIKSVSDKIKLQLQGNPQRKVVNISFSPIKESKIQDKRMNNFKQKSDIELGPDIIIKRIKSGKNKRNSKDREGVNNCTPVDVQNSNSESKANAATNNLDKNVAMKSKLSTAKEVEVPPQIKQLLVDATKNKKPITFKPNELLMARLNSIINNQSIGNIANAEWISNKKKKKLGELKKGDSNNTISKSKFLKGKNKDSDIEMEDGDGESQIINSSLEEDDTFKGFEKVSKKSSKEAKSNNTFDAVTGKNIGGKKTAKVTPLRQIYKEQSKSELLKKGNNDKLRETFEKELPRSQRSKYVPNHSPTDLCILRGKRNYKNAFEKYFICTEKIYELNDIDSDSSEDTNLLSHFIDLKSINMKEKETISLDNHEVVQDKDNTNRLQSGEDGDVNLAKVNRTTEDNFGGASINEVLSDITAELPKWNYHVQPESAVICLFLLEREPNGILDVQKCIEIDSNFKTNVYVNKELVNEYCGFYDNFDAIKNLIYQVDLL